MRNFHKILLPAAGMAITLFVAQALHAQDAQTTTTRETTTTTNQAVPPPPPPPETTTVIAAPMPGFTDYYSVDNYAAHRGYNDGYNKGISDHNTGHSYRPTSDHYYNHPIGYNGGPTSKDEYDRVYREAFLKGYEHGYRSAQ